MFAVSEGQSDNSLPRCRVQYINLIHYNMKAKRISQKAVKNMIIGNFDTGKRTNLKRAVSECVYTSRLYYNKKPKPIANKFLTTIQQAYKQ